MAIKTLVDLDSTQTLTNKTLSGGVLGSASLSSDLITNSNDITGLDELHFTDAIANASAAGRLRRNGAALTWHTGVVARNLNITLGTPQASTSGTVIDFTSIPSGVTHITIMFDQISTNNLSILRVQLGDAGGIETTGYAGSVASTGGVQLWNSSSGIDLNSGSVAAGTYSGMLILSLMNSSTNTWCALGILARTDTASNFYTTGRKATSAVLDRVRITTVNGTDTFDAGEINISYEF